MEDHELIIIRTTRSGADVEKLVAAELEGEWTTPGLHGRVLVTDDGDVTVVESNRRVTVFPDANSELAQRAYAERVFGVVAAGLSDRVELYDSTDKLIRVREALTPTA